MQNVDSQISDDMIIHNNRIELKTADLKSIKDDGSTEKG